MKERQMGDIWQKHEECMRSGEFYPNLKEVTQYLIPLGQSPSKQEDNVEDNEKDKEQNQNN